MPTLKEIIEDLNAGKDVKEIYLRGNQIGDEGAKALAQALQHNNTVMGIDLNKNKIGDELLNDINKLLEKNQLQAEELSKKIDQGIDSVQEKLLATDIRLEEKQKIFKKIQQIKEVAQEQKLEQREAAHDVVAQVINEYKNNVLKARGDKEIQQLIKEYKNDVMIVQLKRMQQTEHSSGTKIISDDNLKLLLSKVSNPADLRESLESLLSLS